MKKKFILLWIGTITILVVGIILMVIYFVWDYKKYEDKNTIEIYDTKYQDVMIKDEEYLVDELFLRLTESLESYNEKNQTEYSLNDFTYTFEKNLFEITNQGFIGKKTGQSKVYLDKAEEGVPAKTLRIIVGDFYVTDSTYTGFTKINTISEFNDKIAENPQGRFILNADLDYQNQAFTPVSQFEGILINPHRFKIKNCIFETQAQQYRIFGTGQQAFIEGIRFENCKVKINDTHINSIAVYQSSSGTATLKNIHFSDIAIDTSDYTGKALSVSFFESGSEAYQYLVNCSVELNQTIAFAEEVKFFELKVFSEINYSKNCYTVLDITTNTDTEIYCFHQARALNSYCVVLGNSKAYTNFYGDDSIFAYGTEAGIWETQNPETLDLEALKSGQKIAGLDEYVFEPGRYPYIA